MTRLQIQICRATEQDAPYIEEKLHKYALDATNLDWRQFFVVKNDLRTVAFGRIIDHGEYFEIASLGVDYYYRQKGIGSKMFVFLIEEAKRLNPRKPIYAVTHKPKFLKKLSFEEVESFPEYLEYKKIHICRLDGSRIKIMKYKGML